MSEQAPPLTIDDVEAAASVGRLAALVRQLVLDGSWSSLDVVFRYAKEAKAPLSEVEEVTTSLMRTVDSTPADRRTASENEIRTRLRQAAFLILERVEASPLTHSERRALRVAADVLVKVGALEPAALAYERAGDDVRAADAYGAIGSLEKMEFCLARDEANRKHRRDVTGALAAFETLCAGGERRAAIRAANTLPPGDLDAHVLAARARDLHRQLCRGQGIDLRIRDQPPVRFATLPAVLGRDAGGEIVWRDPSVSRRHATLSFHEGRLILCDLNSRAGTAFGGAAIRDSVPLPSEGEFTLGGHTRVAFRTLGADLVQLEGKGGIDRALRAVLGPGAVPLDVVWPAAEGLTVRFDAEGCRLERSPGVVVRVAGQLIGPGCDLVHGDAIEIGETDTLRLEVP